MKKYKTEDLFLEDLVLEKLRNGEDLNAKEERKRNEMSILLWKSLLPENRDYPNISFLYDSELDTDDDNWVQFRETCAKENELILCIIGQEMPLIDGIAKRTKWDNIPFSIIANEYGFESCYYMNITLFSILEKEWGYAKIEWGEK